VHVSHLNQVNKLLAAGFSCSQASSPRAIDVWELFCCGIAQSGIGFLCHKQLVDKTDPINSEFYEIIDAS
jgi:hypothetical protein